MHKNHELPINDTIAAIATPSGKGAISLIRVSGFDILSQVNNVIKPRKGSIQSIKPWRLRSAFAHDPKTGLILDEILVVLFKGPKSYTGEDMLEISCHGNPLIVRSILNALISTGIRLAEPGEFTRRAFENGRIDLSRAEAIAVMTAAESDSARHAALRVLDGGLGDPIKTVRNHVMEIRAAFELELDFPDEQESFSDQTIQNLWRDTEKILVNLIDAGFSKNTLEDEHSIVISGKVNAGKSTLFNQLIGRNRAIISNEPGTTRDALEISAHWNEYRLGLVDTAGIRNAVSLAEKEAIRRTQKILQHAELVIYVVDATDPDLETLNKINQDAGFPKMLVFWNKIDLQKGSEHLINTVSKIPNILGVIDGCALDGKGVQNLREKILEHLSANENSYPNALIISVRQQQALEKALSLLQEANELYQSSIGLECITPILRTIDYTLGQILGDTVSPDILAEIFSSFCIGK